MSPSVPRGPQHPHIDPLSHILRRLPDPPADDRPVTLSELRHPSLEPGLKLNVRLPDGTYHYVSHVDLAATTDLTLTGNLVLVVGRRVNRPRYVPPSQPCTRYLTVQAAPPNGAHTEHLDCHLVNGHGGRHETLLNGNMHYFQ